MATKAELRDRLRSKRKRRRKTNKAIRQAKDVKPPKGKARKVLHHLKAVLRRVRRKVQRAIDSLRERIERKDGGPDTAVRWGRSQVGVTESPAGSNWGHPVQDWITYTGYTYPVPWCGCFACYAVVKKGGAKIPERMRMGYGPYIIADARAGRNGFRAVPFSEARPGDVLVYWNGSHIGVAAARPNGSAISTVEGNTSSGSSGSQSNGGGVFARTRYQSDVSVVARPSY